jgi:hypothetical protein
MEIGIDQFRTRRDLWLDRMLVQPLRGPASGHALEADRQRPVSFPQYETSTPRSTE